MQQQQPSRPPPKLREAAEKRFLRFAFSFRNLRKVNWMRLTGASLNCSEICPKNAFVFQLSFLLYPTFDT